MAALTVHELRERAESIAMAVKEARDTLERAREQATRLHRDLERQMSELPRFAYEVTVFLGSMASDLGHGLDCDSDGNVGDFDLDRLTRDARDLVDLIDLGSATRRETADAC